MTSSDLPLRMRMLFLMIVGEMQWMRTKYDTRRRGTLRDYLNVHAMNDKELSWSRAVGMKGRTQGKKKVI